MYALIDIYNNGNYCKFLSFKTLLILMADKYYYLRKNWKKQNQDNIF